jgi:hypothetical protein
MKGVENPSLLESSQSSDCLTPERTCIDRDKIADSPTLQGMIIPHLHPCNICCMLENNLADDPEIFSLTIKE